MYWVPRYYVLCRWHLGLGARAAKVMATGGRLISYPPGDSHRIALLTVEMDDQYYTSINDVSWVDAWKACHTLKLSDTNNQPFKAPGSRLHVPLACRRPAQLFQKHPLPRVVTGYAWYLG